MLRTRNKRLSPALVLFALCSCFALARAQSGSVLYGTLNVDESRTDGSMPLSYTVLLYGLNGLVIGRQPVSGNGQYRFINLRDGDYDLVVEVEGTEIGRVRISIRNPVYKTDIRYDINLGWKDRGNQRARPATIAADDFYKRAALNERLFARARDAIDKKNYSESQSLLRQVVASDPQDFQAWTELGTVALFQHDVAAAEQAYRKSLEVRPRFFLALLNLGRLHVLQRKFDTAIPILLRAVAVRSTSADAHYYLGEAYLQIKKGSKAVDYLYEALRLDPMGKADAHLRLAALYNGAGMKAKAANEYAEFLKKKPAYPDKKKLEAYIAQNRKQ